MDTVTFVQVAPGVVALRAEGRPDIECLMCPMEPTLYDAACELLPDRARGAEVGCFKGGSACIVWFGMLRRGKSMVMACHDLFAPFDLNGATVDVEAAFDASQAAWGFDGIKVKGDSKVTHAIHQDGSLDYVFIDGDHSYEGAAADIANFWPKVKPDGFMLVQDTVPGQGVERAVHELLAHVPHFLVEPPHSHYVIVACRDAARLRALRENVGVGSWPGGDIQ